MRFIAVFNYLQKSYGLRFESLLDAADFLFWGYEDQELIPEGIYDTLTDRATPYEQAGQVLGTASPASIRTTAQRYLSGIRPMSSFLRASAG